MIVLSPDNQMDGRGSIKELFPTGKQLEPLVAPLADGKVAVGQDDLTVVLNEEGVCTQKCALNWTDIPIAMGKRETTTSCCARVLLKLSPTVILDFLLSHAFIFLLLCKTGHIPGLLGFLSFSL